MTAADAFSAETTETFTVTIANSAPVFNSEYEGFVIDAGESRIAIPRGIPLPKDLFTDDFGVTGWKITGVSKDGAAVAGFPRSGWNLIATREFSPGVPARRATTR